MSKQLLLDEKCLLLQKVLGESLRKKRFVEMRIRRQLEELKRLEISLEKMRATQQKDLRDSWCQPL